MLIVVLLQKLTLTIRVYQKLKRHKPVPIRAKQDKAKHLKTLSCWGAELTASQPPTSNTKSDFRRL